MAQCAPGHRFVSEPFSSSCMCDVAARVCIALGCAASPERLSPSCLGTGTGYRAAMLTRHEVTHWSLPPRFAVLCVPRSLAFGSLIADPQGSWMTLVVTPRAPEAEVALTSSKSTSSCFARVQVVVLCPELLLAEVMRLLQCVCCCFNTWPQRRTHEGGLVVITGWLSGTSSASARLCKPVCEMHREEVPSVPGTAVWLHLEPLTKV